MNVSASCSSNYSPRHCFDVNGYNITPTSALEQHGRFWTPSLHCCWALRQSSNAWAYRRQNARLSVPISASCVDTMGLKQVESKPRAGQRRWSAKPCVIDAGYSYYNRHILAEKPACTGVRAEKTFHGRQCWSGDPCVPKTIPKPCVGAETDTQLLCLIYPGAGK